jgi:hypothetical protein
LLLLGIRAKVSSRVVPVWQDYLNGGTGLQNFTATFGNDFAASPTTVATTGFLVGELRRALAASPPSVALGARASVDIPTTIPGPVAQIDNPASRNQMNFAGIGDIAGNLAGGIGNEKANPVGARPSPIDDARKVRGTASIVRTSPTELMVTPSLTYTVEDTVDLCPGDCGAPLEQIATVPFSQWEATGIAGDVPFTVEFAPATPPPPFVISSPLAPPAVAPAAPAAPPTAKVAPPAPAPVKKPTK